MSDVIDINEYKPSLSGPAICLSCKHKWEAVCQLGQYNQFECPKCGLFHGTFEGQIINDPVWVCNCGCDAFSITVEAIYCRLCGKEQRIEGY